MADNNKNPRRTIWLSETEPLSHYDIWLSKNQHLNSEGESVPDSRVLRPCDYIFKVWDCGEWHPIVGLNSTALNKINTVKNLEYNTEHNGDRIHSYSYQEFHLPLFTKPDYSPSELFDAGTIGDAILEYVTVEEWKKIFEGDSFSEAFEYYIQEGDTNINLLVNPAESDKLGGIWADTFRLEDMFPDYATIHIGETELQYDIDDSYEWLAQAKYKYLHGEDDYNLYISAKDIIRIVNKYEHDNPEAPGIQPSDDFEWRYAGHELVGGIWADEFQEDDIFPEGQDYHSPSDISDSYDWLALAKYKLGYDANRPGDYNLYISAKDIIKIVNKYLEDNHDEPGITPGGGATIDPEVLYRSFFNSASIKRDWTDLELDLDASKPRFSLWGAYGDYLANNAGKFLKIRDNAAEWSVNPGPYSDTNNALEWASIDEIYPVLSEEDHVDGTKYVINGGGKENTYLNWLGEWTDPNAGNEYYGDYPIVIDYTSNTISISPQQGNPNKLYLCSENNSVSWQPVDTGETYDVLSREDHLANKPYVINGCGTGISPDKVFLNGNGEWAEPFGDTTYSEGIGITISSEDNTNYINIDTEDADEGLVLAYDGEDGIKWIDVLEYNAGIGIQIESNKISSEIQVGDDNLTYRPTLGVTFNCTLGTSEHPTRALNVIVDGTTEELLLPFNYYYMTIEAEDSIDIHINLTGTDQGSVNQKQAMQGDPVFVELHLVRTGSATFSFNSAGKYIEIGEPFNGGLFKGDDFLITMLFGIIRIEALKQQSNQQSLE